MLDGLNTYAYIYIHPHLCWFRNANIETYMRCAYNIRSDEADLRRARALHWFYCASLSIAILYFLYFLAYNACDKTAPGEENISYHLLYVLYAPV